jgi:hypothetical protein
MYSYPEIKTFRGLYLQRNSFTAPDGAMEVAQNCTIPSDDVIVRARGYYEYFDGSASTLNNLFSYEQKLIAAYETKLAYLEDTGSSPNLTGNQTNLTPDTGVTVEINSLADDTVCRSSQSNGNFYFTTDNGVLKLPAYNGTIFKSGAPQGLDLSARYDRTSSTWFEGGNTVGYRVVFGYTDDNDNLILGAPSEIANINNPLVVGSAWVRASNVVTVTSVAHGLVVGEYIYVSNSASGAPDVVTGSYLIASTPTADTFTFAETAADDAGPNTLDYSYSMPVRLEFSVPSEITTTLTWFAQIYRSSQQLIATGIFSDFKLLDQVNLTSAQIAAQIVYYDDTLDDILLGAELYTNQNSREGELQANFRAPLCKDIAYYKNFTIYGSCTTRHLINLAVVDSTDLATGDFIEVSISSLARRYVGRTGIGNLTVTAICSSSSGLLITTPTAHGFTSTGLWSVYISNQVGGSIANGEYYVLYVSPTTFRVASSVADWVASTAVSYNSETSLDIQGLETSEATVVGSSWVRASNVVTVTSVAHGLYVGMQVYISNAAGGTLTSGLYTITVSVANSFSFASVGSDDASGNTCDYNSYQPMFTISEDTSASVRLRDTAQGIVKAINRDASSSVYAQYASGIDDIPGKMRLQAKGFGDPIYLRANSATSNLAFSPVLPISFASGTQVLSLNDDLPHGFFVSKENEPEAVPLVNFFPVGSKNAAALRFHALRDSIIILKEDGVWRCVGDNPSNFAITLLDGTVQCVAESSSDVLNNQVIFLSNQGVCLVTENSVQIVSRKIEEAIQPILGEINLASYTAAVAYETERLYLITTTKTSESSATITYAYNVLTDAWTTWDAWLFKKAFIGPNDIMYYISLDNMILRERKNNTKLDYCGQNSATVVTSVSADTLTVGITNTSAVPQIGDILVQNDVVAVITGVTINTPITFTLSFDRATTFAVNDTPTMYEHYTAIIKMAPYTGGLLGRVKQFAQFQVHFRDESCTQLAISFSGDTYGGSPVTNWEARVILSGWGNFPWGFEPWGQQSGINLLSGTQAAPMCRIYIPLFQQRGSFIQPILENSVAGEPLNIQAISYAVRAYNERVSR